MKISSMNAVLAGLALLAGAAAVHAHPGVTDVKAFGALGNGSTDDTVAIQNAINAGTNIYFPPGTYLISASLTVNKAITLQGESRTRSLLLAGAGMAASDMVSIATDSPVNVFDLTFTSTAPKTGGAGILLASSAPTTNFNFSSRFARLRFVNQYTSFRSRSAQVWVLEASEFYNSAAHGLYIQDDVTATNGDGGDNTVMNNLFVITDSTTTNAIAIEHRSGGGLRLVSNKVLGHSVAYRMCLLDAMNTSILLVSANSFEAQRDRAIQLRRCGGTSLTHGFSSISIVGNQFNPGNASSPAGVVGIEVLDGGSNANPGWLHTATISSNVFSALAGSPVTSVAISAGRHINVSNNTITGTSVGIAVYAPATNVRLGPNSYNTVTTPFYVDPASTGSGTCSVGGVGCANYN